MKRETIKTLIGVTLAASFLAWSHCSRGEEHGPPSVSQQTGIPITADDLYSAYAANEVAAWQKYKGKVLSISGIVQGVAKYRKGSAVNLLTGDGKGAVQCYFEEAHNQAVAKLTRGQRVTIKGRCDQFFEGTVLVSDCAIE